MKMTLRFMPQFPDPYSAAAKSIYGQNQSAIVKEITGAACSRRISLPWPADNVVLTPAINWDPNCFVEAPPRRFDARTVFNMFPSWPR
jgi:hypothetical protein